MNSRASVSAIGNSGLKTACSSASSRSPGFARSYAFLGVDYGSIDTSFTRGAIPCRTPDGVAHYLEHKMFDLPEDNAMNLFAAHGGYPNAFTGYAMTAYYFDCTEQFAENLRILLRMVLTPWFPAESVEKERGIIAQEIRMYEDSADSRAYEDLFGAMFAHHPIRVPIAGTVESIGEITPQVLQDCHAAFYAPANLMLCVTGDVDPALVEEIARAESANAHAEPVPVRDYGPAEAMTCPTQRTVRHMEIAMPTFCLGFKCEPPARGLESMRREIIGDLAAEILVGESSALYTRLYDEGLINSDFSAGYESVRDACLFSAGGDSRDRTPCSAPFWTRRSACPARALTARCLTGSSVRRSAAAPATLTALKVCATVCVPTTSTAWITSPSRRPTLPSRPRTCCNSSGRSSARSAPRSASFFPMKVRNPHEHLLNQSHQLPRARH